MKKINPIDRPEVKGNTQIGTITFVFRKPIICSLKRNDSVKTVKDRTIVILFFLKVISVIILIFFSQR